MTTRRGSRYTRRARGPRARYEWADRINAAETNLAAGGQANVDLIENVAAATKNGATVVRLLLWLSLRMAGANVSGEFAHGVIVVSEDAMTGGAVPDPSQDNVAWYLYENGMLFSEAVTNAGSRHLSYDIRTARKLRESGSVLLHAIINNHSANAMVYNVGSRVLLRLH